MARIHHQAFADFVLAGKGSTHGALTMRGNHVFSYDREICAIERNYNLIVVETTKISRTTSAHQSAVLMGFKLHLASKGWKMTEYQQGEPASSVALRARKALGF